MNNTNNNSNGAVASVPRFSLMPVVFGDMQFNVQVTERDTVVDGKVVTRKSQKLASGLIRDGEKLGDAKRRIALEKGITPSAAMRLIEAEKSALAAKVGAAIEKARVMPGARENASVRVTKTGLSMGRSVHVPTAEVLKARNHKEQLEDLSHRIQHDSEFADTVTKLLAAKK